MPGPGAIDGIRKCFSDTGGMSDADVIRVMAERQEAEFERLGLDFRTLWGRRLQLIDCQNLFCEVDKYARVVHPEASGASGRTRIKQKFRPHPDPIEYWYPPKWGINDAVGASARPGTAARPRCSRPSGRRRWTFAHIRSGPRRRTATPARTSRPRMIPLAGLASETGELLGEYKKYLRDGENPTSCSRSGWPRRWATCCGTSPTWPPSSTSTSPRWPSRTWPSARGAGASCRTGRRSTRVSEDERFPRQFSIDFLTYHDEDDSPKVRVMYKGKQFGDDLTDNAHIKDGYGYHDVIHLAFAAVLGWSPLVRKMLGVKRKSDPKVDQVEDGGRAIATEEGLSAMIFAYARDYNFFEGKSSVSTELLRMIKNMVRHLEVSACSPGEWEQAIIQGFKVWREVKKRRGGTVDVDLDKRYDLAPGN